MNNKILLVSYCLLTETLSDYNWVTIRRGCGVGERTTKEKKKLKKMVTATFQIPNQAKQSIGQKQSIGTKAPRTSADEVIRPEIGKVIRTI